MLNKFRLMTLGFHPWPKMHEALVPVQCQASNLFQHRRYHPSVDVINSLGTFIRSYLQRASLSRCRFSNSGFLLLK